MLIIDRFEEEYAVGENEDIKMINIPISYLPKESKEGDCIELVNDKYIINYKETKILKGKIEKLMKSLWK